MKKKIPADKLLLVLSTLLLLIACVVLYNAYEKMQIAKRNEIILAKVLEVPESCSEIKSNWDGYCKLKFEKKVYVIRAGKNFCSKVINSEFVEMLTDMERSRLMFEGEYNPNEFGNGIFILTISIVALYMSISSINIK